MCVCIFIAENFEICTKKKKIIVIIIYISLNEYFFFSVCFLYIKVYFIENAETNRIIKLCVYYMADKKKSCDYNKQEAKTM